MKDFSHHVLTFDFPDEYAGHNKYREAPHHIVGSFKDHVKATYQPEHFPGLFWGRLQPNEPFEILCEFAVDRKKRPEGDYIPCPMCAKKEKFLEGCLVFIFVRQCIAIIGHDCAAADVKHAAWTKKKADDRRRHLEDFLLRWLQRVPAALRAIDNLLTKAQGIESIYHALKAGAPRIQKALQQACKAGGELALTEMIDNEAAKYSDQAPKRVVRDHYIGTPRGQTLVRPKCKFVSDLRVTKNLLLGFEGCDDEEVALAKTIDLIEQGDGPKAVEYILKAFQTLDKLTADMSEVRHFFAQDNIDSLRAWGAHRLQPLPFMVERQAWDGGITVTFSRQTGKDEDREYARIVLSAALAEWREDHKILSDFDAMFAMDQAYRFSRRKRS